MADSILRLKVESQEYDNKLKRAAEGLQRYANECHKAGGTLEYLDDGVLEFTKALGSMETVSKSAKGSISEMTKAFTDLSVKYNKLTEEEKNSPFGKALAESLDSLKGRIKDGNTELKNIGTSLNDTGGILGQLKDKFTINIDALTLFNTGLLAAKAALDVAKDAFFASEANVDEWGRTMEAGKSLYEGFLTALNTGDISGYLSRIDSIVQAARQAYDELDRLGTTKTIQAPRMSAQQTENERMRMMIQTGRYIAPVDGRKASMQNGQLLTPDQIKRIEQQLQNGMKEVVSLVGNEVKQTSKAIDAVYNRQAQELGLSLKEFRKGTSSMAEFDKRIEGYNQYQKWRSEHTTIDLQSGRETVARGNPFEQFAKWGAFRVDGGRYNDLVKLIQQRDQQAGQAYNMQSQAYHTMNRAEGVTVRSIMGGGGGRGGGGGTGVDINQLLKDSWNKASMVDGEKAMELTGPSKAWEAYVESVKQGSEDAADSIKSLEKAFESLNKAEGAEARENTAKNVKAIGESARITASMVGTIGQAFNAIEDPAAKVMGTVAQAIATVALAYADTLAKDQSSKSNVWAFIAAAAAATVSMATTIANIHSATGYAQGGEIKGNSYSGDNIPVMVNAGEVVLTKAMAGNLASQLQSNGGGGTYQPSHISGEQIYIALNRYMRRSGRGEIVTWKS